jgi:hypothetical protein
VVKDFKKKVDTGKHKLAKSHDFSNDYKFKGNKKGPSRKNYYEVDDVTEGTAGVGEVSVSNQNKGNQEGYGAEYTGNKGKQKQRPKKKNQQKEVPNRNKGMLVDYDEILKQKNEQKVEDNKIIPEEEVQNVVRLEDVSTQHERVGLREIGFEPEFREHLDDLSQRSDRQYGYEQPRGYGPDFTKSPYQQKPFEQPRPRHYEGYGHHFDPRDRYYEHDYNRQPHYEHHGYYEPQDYRQQPHFNEDYRGGYFDNRDIRQYEKMQPVHKPMEYRGEGNVDNVVPENNDRLRDKLMNITTQRSNGVSEPEVRDVNKTNLDSLRSYFDRLRKFTPHMEKDNGKDKSILSSAGSNTGYVFEK